MLRCFSGHTASLVHPGKSPVWPVRPCRDRFWDSLDGALTCALDALGTMHAVQAEELLKCQVSQVCWQSINRREQFFRILQIYPCAMYSLRRMWALFWPFGARTELDMKRTPQCLSLWFQYWFLIWHGSNTNAIAKTHLPMLAAKEFPSCFDITQAQ